MFPRVVDWNQDGKQDLVWGLADGTLQVTLNENTAAEPRFGTPLVVQVGPTESKATCDVGDRATFAIVDWNNDGRADLVLGGLDGKIHVLLNEATAGLPDFRSDTVVLDGANPLTVSSGRASVAVVDLNDDGRKDLVLGNTEGQLVYYANLGTDASPQFNGSQLLQADGAVIDLSGIPRSRPFVGDVNGDGVPDMLVGAADGLVRRYLGSRTSGATGSTVGDPGGTYVYGFRVESASATNPWQCPVFPLDVNHDGLITPLDALIVINLLNAQRTGHAACPAHCGTVAAALFRLFGRRGSYGTGRTLGHQRHQCLRSCAEFLIRPARVSKTCRFFRPRASRPTWRRRWTTSLPT